MIVARVVSRLGYYHLGNGCFYILLSGQRLACGLVHHRLVKQTLLIIFFEPRPLGTTSTYVETGKVARNPGGYSTIDNQLRVI